MKRALAVLALGAVACGRLGLLTGETFACMTSDECASGFECVAQQCVAAAGGTDGGGTDAGPGDAGATDAGGTTDGGSDAGAPVCWNVPTDDFLATTNPAWVLAGDAVFMAGNLFIPVTSRNSMPQVSSATSVRTADLVGCGLTFQFEVPPTPVAGYSGSAGVFRDNANDRPAFQWTFDSRGLVATWTLSDGGTGAQVAVAQGSPMPAWLRIEEVAGEVRWSAADSTTFVTHHTLPHSEDLTGLKLRFDGRFPAQMGADTVTYQVDNLNLGP